ncbi:MAG: DUF4118 domain-containing protein [Clostridia bacterium]|nr:DUF4118 domain-containing protein [Clostridia bacterium]
MVRRDWRRTADDLRDALIPRNQSKQQIARNMAVTIGLLLGASAVCVLLNRISSSDQAVPMVFVLAVLLTARVTDGFFYGLFASVASVIGVNYVFTYPYFEINFTITGYPITFLTMFAVSSVVGMLTAQVKRQSRIEAEAEMAKMKASLLRSVSHDLRTPLTSIIGSSSAVLENYDEFDDSVKKDLIGHVRDEAQWLKQLVENILSITRMKNGPAQIVKNQEAVEEIAAEAVAKFKKQYPQMRVRVNVPEELMMAPMDAVLIEQVLINLMENAVRHGKHTTLIELCIAERGNMAVFAVKDDGCGIDEALIPSLFEELFPNAQNMGDTTRSLGIGLSVCLSIVKAHGGEMSARNRAGGGACVTFTLPLEEECA